MTADIIALDSRRKRKIAPVVMTPMFAAASFCISIGMLFLIFGIATCYALQGRRE